MTNSSDSQKKRFKLKIRGDIVKFTCECGMVAMVHVGTDSDWSYDPGSAVSSFDIGCTVNPRHGVNINEIDLDIFCERCLNWPYYSEGWFPCVDCPDCDDLQIAELTRLKLLGLL